jgi:hypothetical protein
LGTLLLATLTTAGITALLVSLAGLFHEKVPEAAVTPARAPLIDAEIAEV